jgi:hypothetical protein
VRSRHGLVIEFQHSHIDPHERSARESFYGNMVWVVDCTRLMRDYSRFAKGKDSLRPTNIRGYFLLSFPEECFPRMWLDSSVPVIFDFRGLDDALPPDAYRDGLWCLLPGRAEGSAVVIGMSREQFVEIAPSRNELLPVGDIMIGFAQRIREVRELQRAHEFRRFSGMPVRSSPGRRFRRF